MEAIKESRSTKVAKEDYLMVIKILNDFYGKAPLTMIANELDVTPATAHKVIEHLESSGYVVKVGRGVYSLTNNGNELASKILGKHRILEIFLGILGFNALDIHIYAHELEHVNDLVVNRIYNMLGGPRVCPHGNPIYGKPEGINLSKSYPSKVTIVAVAELKNVLNFLINNKIGVNDTLTVLKRRKGNVMIEFNGRRLIIDSSVAPGIIVVEKEH